MLPVAEPGPYAFLGCEFLTWLWYRCEVAGGLFKLPQGDVGIVLADYVQLTALEGDQEQSILKKCSAHTAPEARTALRSGKLVSAAKLELALGDRPYAVTIDGPTLGLRSIRYPKLEDSEPKDRAAEKLGCMEELSSIIESLFQQFLTLRVGDDWDDEADSMRAWAKGN
jgi:hypothetical protein